MLTYWTLPMIGTMIEAPAGTDFAPDLNVYLFLGVVTLVTGVCSGLAPAWHSRGADLLTPLKGEGSRQNRAAPRRLRSLLIVTQSAVSVLLIVMATLFVRATIRAASIDVGFDPAGLYAVSPGLGLETFEGEGAGIGANWRARALSELEAVPGIAAVSLAELPPFGDGIRTSVSGEGPTQVVTHFNRTRADYFETIGLRILAGRTFTPDEVAAAGSVVLVSESVARAYWHDQSLARPTTAAADPGIVAPASGDRCGDRRITAHLHEHSAFAVYEPLGPAGEGFAQLMIRVAPGTTGVIDEARHRLRSIDPQADVRVTSVAARLRQEAGRPRMLAALTGIVGAIAIVLCVIGLYGLTASVVGQRTREMGLRVAMGAEPGDLLRLLMWDSLRPVAFGLLIGAGGALLASRVIAGILFGVSPQDPVAFVGAAVILLGAASLAVLVPTRRAASVDPAFVLRQS